MTREQEESEVGELLQERAELARLHLELPPAKLQLLKRLLNMLGWTNMKLRRRELLTRLARSKPTEYSLPEQADQHAIDMTELAHRASEYAFHGDDRFAHDREYPDDTAHQRAYEHANEPKVAAHFHTIAAKNHLIHADRLAKAGEPVPSQYHHDAAEAHLAALNAHDPYAPPPDVHSRHNQNWNGRSTENRPFTVINPPDGSDPLRVYRLPDTTITESSADGSEYLYPGHPPLSWLGRWLFRGSGKSAEYHWTPPERSQMSRRHETLLKLARKVGVKRYAGPVEPNQPKSGPLAPWRQPQAPKPAPKIGTALKSIQDTSLAIPVSTDPFPIKRDTHVSVPTRSSVYGGRRGHEVDVRRPGGFDLNSRRGRQDFLDYLNETGEDRELQHRLEKAVGSHIARNDDIRPLVMSRRQQVLYRLAHRAGMKRYAKLDSRHEAHPLVQGFPIETALRHLANDPANHESIRELAKVAVTGGKNKDASNVPTALWALHDALHEHNHPMKNTYNWLSAADKIGLDAHTHNALKEISERNKALQRRLEPEGINEDQWNLTPEYVGWQAGHQLNTDKSRLDDDSTLASVRRHVSAASPRSTPEEIDESIRRHAHRALGAWRNLQENFNGDDFKDLDLLPASKKESPSHVITNEKATRYSRLRRLFQRINSSKAGELKRYKMVAGDFLEALRRINSTQQKGIKDTLETIAAKIGAKPASTVNALHDSPTYSVPGVAMAIYANAKPEAIQALAAWGGLTGNIPGMAVFHVRPDGPDMLHRFRAQGSGHDLRNRLDKAGLTNRILVPHRTGFDVLIPDRTGELRQRVQDFTKQQKTELQSSRGHFKTIGSSDQSRAREMFRNAIVKSEQRSEKGT